MEPSIAQLFTDRPPREHRCTVCEGRGVIALPYCLIPSDEPIPGAPADAVHAAVVGAASIFDASHEAKGIAVRCLRPVAFLFNGTTVIVGPTDQAVQVARAWWLKVYHETPEQSLARR